MKLLRSVFGCLLLFIAGIANAGLVTYTATSLGGNTWRYDYTITASASGFDELTIYFSPSLYSALNSPAAPSGWDPLVIQPDTGIPADGFFDVLNESGLLPGGDVISGFSVVFDYLGSGTPGAQAFDYYDSSTFTLLGSGRTSDGDGPTNNVPEPATALLILFGMSGLLLRLKPSKSA